MNIQKIKLTFALLKLLAVVCLSFVGYAISALLGLTNSAGFMQRSRQLIEEQQAQAAELERRVKELKK